MHTDTTIVVPPGEKQMRDTWTMPGELSQISEAVEKGGGAATVILEKPVEAAAEAAPAAAPALDFDLDLGSPAAAPAAAAPAAPAKAEEPAGLDFDLGLDFKAPEAKPAAYNAETTMIVDVKQASQPAADLALDIKLDEPAAPGAEEALHFDLDLGAPAAPSAAAASEVVDLEKTIAGGNAVDFDFNIGAPTAKAAPPAEPGVDLGAISLDLGQPAAAPEGGAGDDIATKLELAKAYEEMGDKEGARELLGEVIKEGNAEQQAKAQSMLSKLS
jgi:pilus assembly protein FimV